jgi:diketogulonate reductase-like aldo/keto reductase
VALNTVTLTLALHFLSCNRYNKTAAQILIRWSVQHGYITIPKSSKPNRIKENMEVFDWSLAEDDMQLLV